jgi:hypothetical protein
MHLFANLHFMIAPLSPRSHTPRSHYTTLDLSTFMYTIASLMLPTLDLSTFMDTIATLTLPHARSIHFYGYNRHTHAPPRSIYPLLWIQSPHSHFPTLDLSTFMDTIATLTLPLHSPLESSITKMYTKYMRRAILWDVCMKNKEIKQH